MKKNTDKTNVMRLLDQKKISYTSYCYIDTDVISGIDVASVLNQDPNQVFKTLVSAQRSRKVKSHASKHIYCVSNTVNHVGHRHGIPLFQP